MSVPGPTKAFPFFLVMLGIGVALLVAGGLPFAITAVLSSAGIVSDGWAIVVGLCVGFPISFAGSVSLFRWLGGP